MHSALTEEESNSDSIQPKREPLVSRKASSRRRRTSPADISSTKPNAPRPPMQRHGSVADARLHEFSEQVDKELKQDLTTFTVIKKNTFLFVNFFILNQL